MLISAALVLIIAHGENASKGEVEGLELISAENISAIYAEDGSNEQLDSVLAISVKNTGDKMIDMANLTLTDRKSGEEYCFSLTHLPAGKTARVMELDKKSAPEESLDKLVLGGKVENELSLPGVRTEPGAVLKVTAAGDGVKVTNVSGAPVLEAMIFYKYYDSEENVYIGGKTGALKLSTPLQPGESADIPNASMAEFSIQVLFVCVVSEVS